MTINEGLKIGLISGLISAIIIGLFRLFVKLFHIIRVATENQNLDRIIIKNIGLSIFKLPFAEISAQICFKHNDIPNKYTILVEGQNTYVSPSNLEGLGIKQFFRYHFSSCHNKEAIIRQGRRLKLDYSAVQVVNNANQFNSYNSFLNAQFNFIDVHLKIYISYYGKITNVHKSKEFTIKP